MNWKLWITQAAAILRLDLKRNLASKRAIPVYLLACAPLVLFGLHSISHARGWMRPCSGDRDLMIFAGTFQIFTLRLAVFFSAVAVFMNLFRGEVIEKTLHYYLLAPVRREVLVAGKYLAGLLSTSMVFGLSTLFSYLIVCNHLAMTRSRALAGPALGDAWAYTGLVVLACAGYGAVFLILGLLFRNPILPALGVLLWESLIIYLPPLLKKFSVIFYLESLCPVKLPFGGGSALFAISADPTPAYLAIPGLLVLTAAVLTLACIRIRKLEISYGTE